MIDICTSAGDLSVKLGRSSYDLIAIGQTLFPHYLASQKRSDQLLVPCIVTASKEERAWASTALQDDAFDLIVKPIVPEQAVQAVKLALGQAVNFMRLREVFASP